MPSADIRDYETIESRGWEKIFHAAPSPVIEALGLRGRRLGEIFACVAPPIPGQLFNRAVGVVEPFDAEQLALLGAFAREVERFSVQVPEPLRAACEPALAVGGWRPDEAWTKCVRSTHDAPSVEHPVRIATAEDAQRFGAAFCEGYGMPGPLQPWTANLVALPGFRAYAVDDGAAIVGTALLYVDGEVGWCGGAAVLPSHRGRRIQRAMLAQRIADAAALGARVVVAETWSETAGEVNPSLRSMLAAGFAVAYERANFVRVT